MIVKTLKEIVISVKNQIKLLNHAIKNHLIVMTLPDKPNSKNQKYVRL